LLSGGAVMELWFVDGGDSMLARCLLALALERKRYMIYGLQRMGSRGITGKFMVQCDCAPMLERCSETVEAWI